MRVSNRCHGFIAWASAAVCMESMPRSHPHVYVCVCIFQQHLDLAHHLTNESTSVKYACVCIFITIYRAPPLTNEITSVVWVCACSTSIIDRANRLAGGKTDATRNAVKKKRTILNSVCVVWFCACEPTPPLSSIPQSNSGMHQASTQHNQPTPLAHLPLAPGTAVVAQRGKVRRPRHVLVLRARRLGEEGRVLLRRELVQQNLRHPESRNSVTEVGGRWEGGWGGGEGGREERAKPCDLWYQLACVFWSAAAMVLPDSATLMTGNSSHHQDSTTCVSVRAKRVFAFGTSS